MSAETAGVVKRRGAPSAAALRTTLEAMAYVLRETRSRLVHFKGAFDEPCLWCGYKPRCQAEAKPPVEALPSVHSLCVIYEFRSKISALIKLGFFVAQVRCRMPLLKYG